MTPVRQHSTTDGNDTADAVTPRSAQAHRGHARADLPDTLTLDWTRSSFSLGNGDCVECARTTTGNIVVRDSKDLNGPVMTFTATEWRTFISRVRHGDFDRPGAVTWH
jgi:hypothetical protein